ncbi:LysR family transcriptional regulator [Niallia sp. 03133]|uniref:LysR family transcriptional regulator n=1 Tax=Niallia sp. 03133 TaxID=3458060 RepID=UPI0040440363
MVIIRSITVEINLLKTFIVAAKNKNFRKTSDELFLSQPAITKQIRKLEENLNVPLFDRTGKTICLTEAGYSFLPYAKEIVTKYEQGLDDFESWKQGYKRKLIIAAAPQIASSILPSILRSFMDENPDIEVLVNVLSSFEIGEEISAGKADIGLSRIEPVQTNIDCRVIHKDPVLLVGPAEEKEFPLDEKNVLQKYRLITHNHPAYWNSLLNDIKRSYPAVRLLKVNQMEVTKRFIEAGLGISYLPYSIVQEELKWNKLVEIKADKVMLPTSYTYLITKLITREATPFIAFLQEKLER